MNDFSGSRVRFQVKTLGKNNSISKKCVVVEMCRGRSEFRTDTQAVMVPKVS